MAWTRNSTTGALTHSGTSMEFWEIDATAPPRAEFIAGLTSTAGNVKISVRPSADGATGFRAGIEGTQLVIEEWLFGSLVSTWATVAHGITSGQAFRLRVTLDGDTITAYAGQTDTSEVSVTHTSANFQGYSARVGVTSDENNAVVSYWQMGEIKDRVLTLDEVGIAVIGGSLFRSLSPSQWELVEEGVFGRTATVGMASLLGKMYSVGGGNARVYDAVGNTVDLWTPSSGTLPGQTDPGTTTATMVREHLGGLVLAGMPEETVTIYGTALNDPLNLDTGDTLVFGSAYVIGVGRNVTVGDPIVAIDGGPASTLFVGCSNSVNFMVGDPYRGTNSIETIDRTVGPSGANAVLRITTPNGGQATIMHSPHGLYVVGPLTAPVRLNENVLDGIVTFPADERSDYKVVLLRDPARQWLHIFIDDGNAETSTHLIYHEATGKYRRGAPGYYPVKLPFRVTAAALVRGVPIVGTSDGRLLRFSETATNDAGEAIDSLVTMQLIDVPPMDNDVIIRKPMVQLGSGSSAATMRLFGGATAEDAFDGDVRRQLWQETVSVRGFRSSAVARAPFLTMTLSTNGVGERLVLERVEASFQTAARSIGSGWVARSSPAAICTPPVVVTPGGGPSGGGTGSGGPGGGGAPPPPPPPPPPPIPTSYPVGQDDAGQWTSSGAFEGEDQYVLNVFDAGYGPEGFDWIPESIPFVDPSSNAQLVPSGIDRPSEPPPDPKATPSHVGDGSEFEF